jgi:hypothetical protein
VEPIITLIGTVHNERGLCNEYELLQILEAVRPQVVFEETRPIDFGSFHTLETRAVGRYSTKCPIKRVPVDAFQAPATLRRDVDALFERAESNVEYVALLNEKSQKTFQEGFPYLNSPEFEWLSNRSRVMFERVVAASGDEHLKRTLSTWNDLLRQREEAMLENIYAFCRTNLFTNGTFLIGAEHLPAMAKRIDACLKAEANIVNWERWKSA